MLALARTAVDTLEEAVKNGSVPASIAVLKGVGLLDGSPPSIGPSDPEEVEAAETERRVLKALNRPF